MLAAPAELSSAPALVRPVIPGAGRFDRALARELLLVRGAEQEELFAQARAAREKVFGRRIVVRGLIELTNQCRVNCEFCPMRRDNTKQNSIFTLDADHVLEVAEHIKDAGINIVFLQAGELPKTTALAAAIIPRVRSLYDGAVEMLLCLGNKSPGEFAQLRELGATSYILKHETSDPELNERMRHSSFPQRLDCLRTLKSLGYRTGTGTIIGLPGQTVDSLLDDIELALELKASMFSASPFIPAPDTPLAHLPSGDTELTLNFIALSRLIHPEWLIPSVSALERREEGGQARGLAAGANVLTINFTPDAEREKYLIYGKDRYIVKRNHAREIAAAAGLEIGTSTFLETGLVA